MLTMQLTIEGAKRRFFDRDIIDRSVARAKRRNLSRSGAFVRQRARSLIRRPRRMRLSEMRQDMRRVFRIRMSEHERGNRSRRPELPLAPSEPGTPPRRGPSDLLRRFIFFAWEPIRETVVVGPVALGRPRPEGSAAQTVPELLEFGGTYERWGKRRAMAPRPYMGTALDLEMDNFPFLWRDSVR
jgi:hypothetical protein